MGWKIRPLETIVTQLGGRLPGLVTLETGTVYDVRTQEARRLIAMGVAERVLSGDPDYQNAVHPVPNEPD